MAIKETLKQRNAKFEAGVHSRGAIKATKKNKQDTSKPAISPTLVGLLIFIICGSAVIGLLQTLLSSYLTPERTITPEMLQQFQMQQAQQEQQQGFGSLSDFPLSDVYQAPADDFEPAVAETVNLDGDEVENE